MRSIDATRNICAVIALWSLVTFAQPPTKPPTPQVLDPATKNGVELIVSKKLDGIRLDIVLALLAILGAIGALGGAAALFEIQRSIRERIDKEINDGMENAIDKVAAKLAEIAAVDRVNQGHDHWLVAISIDSRLSTTESEFPPAIDPRAEVYIRLAVDAWERALHQARQLQRATEAGWVQHEAAEWIRHEAHQSTAYVKALRMPTGTLDRDEVQEMLDHTRAAVLSLDDLAPLTTDSVRENWTDTYFFVRACMKKLPPGPARALIPAEFAEASRRLADLERTASAWSHTVLQRYRGVF